MSNSSIKKILSASQVVPLLFFVVMLLYSIITGEYSLSILVDLILIEIAFVFPAFLIIYLQSVKQSERVTRLPDKHLLFSYLRGLTISVIISLVVALFIEVLNLYKVDFRTGLLELALVSPFVTTIFAIKQSL